ncbi:MAG: peptidoglycan DD-metalloendopeptidase family protein [Flavisolibacter sp.]|nr:peptidoglycan DD-metalloendopeptidase family protein [Flavisolibacter sp.]
MKKLLIIITCFLTVLSGFGQLANEKAKLEKERQDIQDEIREIQSNYNKVTGLKKESLAKLAILQHKLQLQDRLIGNINKEIRSIDDEIYLGNVEIYRLQVQLDTLKVQYARSVVYAYKNNTSYDFLNFIFSANSFNDALNRISYLKSYRAYRQEQVTAIQDRQKLIADKKQQLLAKQAQKKSVLQDQQVQLNELASQKKEKDAVVSKLKSQEKQLSKEIAAKKKRDKQLQGQITAIIRRIIEAERKESLAKNNTTTTTTTNSTNTNTSTKNTTAKKEYFNLNEGQKNLAASFEKNKGGLPWPVDNGVVTIPFGSSVVGGLSIDNPGITISTPSSGGAVKAVFNGEVSAVSNLGDGMMVMIRHGKYFTIYSNLTSATVSKGSTVSTGQVIGRTGEADDGSGGQLDFMLMVENKNVNPSPWLRR